VSHSKIVARLKYLEKKSFFKQVQKTFIYKRVPAIFVSLLSTSKILIVFIYISPGPKFKTQLTSVFEDTIHLSNKFSSIMGMGDANSRLGHHNTKVGTERYSQDVKFNSNGKSLLELANQLDLVIANGAYDGDREGQLTFVSDINAGSSVIDLLIFTPPLASQLSSVNVLSLTHSTHFPILATLNRNTQCNTTPAVLHNPKVRVPQNQDIVQHLK